MTVMGSLTNIAKQRPTFFGRVVQAFETLHGMLFILHFDSNLYHTVVTFDTPEEKVF